MKLSVKSIILIFLLILILIFLLYRLAQPVMNDVSTSLDAPTEFAGADRNYVTGKEDLQRKHYPEVMPLKLDQSPDVIYKKINDLIKSHYKWEITFENKEQFKLEAVSKSRFLKFKDRVVIQVQAFETGSVVNMRSRSDLGRSDFGANAKRIVEFLTSLRAEVEK